MVLFRRGELYPVVGIGKLLDEIPQANLPDIDGVEGVDQLLAEELAVGGQGWIEAQWLALLIDRIAIELAIVLAEHKVRQGGVWIVRCPLPAFVAYFDAVGRSVLSKRAIAQRFKTRRRQGAAVSIDGVLGQAPGQVHDVVHQIATDLAAGVGDTPREMLVLVRHQQEPGCFDGVRCEQVLRAYGRSGACLRA